MIVGDAPRFPDRFFAEILELVKYALAVTATLHFINPSNPNSTPPSGVPCTPRLGGITDQSVSHNRD
jgi:hypothetical protein